MFRLSFSRFLSLVLRSGILAGELKRAGAVLRALARGPGGWRFVRLDGGWFGFVGAVDRLMEAIAAARHLDNFGMVQEAVQNGGGGGGVVEQLAPFLNGPVGGHERGMIFVAAQNDFQQDFPRLGRQGLEAHVIDDEQVGFEVAAQAAIQGGGRGFGLEFAHQLENGAVENQKTGLDGV